MKLRLILFALAVSILTASCSAQTAAPVYPPRGGPGGEIRTLMFAGVQHEYKIQTVKAPGKHPVVILLHGAQGNDQRGWDETSLPSIGAKEGFVFVSPSSTEKAHWNDGRGTTLGGGKASTADDTGYLKALIAELIANDDVDPNAVFMAGISNGGFMTLHFACVASELLHAGGDVIGALGNNQLDACKGGKPLPWITIHGDADPVVKFAGMADAPGQTGFLSSDATFTLMADKAGCSKDVKVTKLPDADHATAEKRVRAGCVGGTTSTQYVLYGGGHAVPGPSAKTDTIFGKINQDVDAGTVIWAHFKQTLTAAAKK